MLQRILSSPFLGYSEIHLPLCWKSSQKCELYIEKIFLQAVNPGRIYSNWSVVVYFQETRLDIIILGG